MIIFKKNWLMLFAILNTTLVFAQEHSQISAIKNTQIIDVENGHIAQNMTVIIKDDHIEKVGLSKNTKIPKHAKIIDGKGKYLIPGLWDMHAHGSSENNTRNVIYPLFIANGITSARIMSADCNEPCRPLVMTIKQSRKLQNEIKNGELIGPRLTLGSIYVNGALPKDSATIKKPRTAEQGKKLVHLLLERGVDFIKIYDGLPRDAYFGIAEEARKEHLPFVGHNPLKVKSSEVSDAGQKSIEHCCDRNLFLECSSREDELRGKFFDEYFADTTKNLSNIVLEMVESYDQNKCDKIMAKFVKNKTYFVPTLYVGDLAQPREIPWQKDPRLKYMPKDEVKLWEEDEKMISTFFGKPNPIIRQKTFELVRKMQNAGVNILAGSDCGVVGIFYGESLHEELALLVEAGLTPLQALQAATLKPAEYAQETKILGSIKKGMLADLVLLNKNPLKDIKNTQSINTVISNGKVYDRKTLDEILAKVVVEAAK